LSTEPERSANVKAGVLQHAMNDARLIELLAVDLLGAAIRATHSSKRGNPSSQSPGANLVLKLDQTNPIFTVREGLFTATAAAGLGDVENQKTAWLKRVEYVAIDAL
jgi:hypothetical protein